MCPNCGEELAPIIYGNWSQDMIPLFEQNKVILASDRSKYISTPESHCFSCGMSSSVVVPIPNL
jgi:hypothetical protein